MFPRNIEFCSFCGGNRFRTVFEYSEAPTGEIDLGIFAPQKYRRTILGCETCGHYYPTHQTNPKTLYAGAYNNSTYGSDLGMQQSFERLTKLAPEQSDNYGRCNRIERHLHEHIGQYDPATVSILDIGSGLGIFPFAMAQRGYSVTALDPDPKSAAHIRSLANVIALCGDFFELMPQSHYDVITFNKVLEHVTNPITMLRRAGFFLKPGGVVYLELPDGEAAETMGSGREEFFIDHLHVFSFSSISLLVDCSGFYAFTIERQQKPSTKRTIRAIATKQ